MIYMFGFVTSAELPSIYYVALWWAATILLRLLICIVCWLPLSHQRVFRPKSQSSRVSRLIHLYTKPSDIVYFDSSKRTILFLPVCAIYTQTMVGLYTLSVFWLRVMRQFVLYHLIKAPALFLMCLLLGYVGRLSSPLTHSSVIICGTLASHVTSAFRDAVESIRHVPGHILTHVLTTATTASNINQDCRRTFFDPIRLRIYEIAIASLFAITNFIDCFMHRVCLTWCT